MIKLTKVSITKNTLQITKIFLKYMELLTTCILRLLHAISCPTRMVMHNLQK